VVTKPNVEIKKDIPNEDFECNPNGECWCKEEEFPPIPDSYDKTQCLSPEAVEQLRLEQTMVDEMEKRLV